jgi:hypothetical protein
MKQWNAKFQKNECGAISNLRNQMIIFFKNKFLVAQNSE